jgi:hypothetical protein
VTAGSSLFLFTSSRVAPVLLVVLQLMLGSFSPHLKKALEVFFLRLADMIYVQQIFVQRTQNFIN